MKMSHDYKIVIEWYIIYNMYVFMFMYVILQLLTIIEAEIKSIQNKERVAFRKPVGNGQVQLSSSICFMSMRYDY